MESVIFYTTGCPKCAVMKKKLDLAQISYEENSDIDEMRCLGMKSAPALSVDGVLMDFGKAVKWLNEYISERAPSD